MKTRLLLIFLSLTSCLLAQDVKRNQTVTGVTALEASAGINVFLRQGTPESVRIEAKGFEEDEIIAEKQGDKLVLSTRRRRGGGWSFGPFGKSRYVNAYVTVRTLNSISVSSGADLTGETTLTADDLTIRASSGADLKMVVKTNRLTVSVSGGADATLSGSTEKLTASVSGGADLDADKLIADVCYAEASGGGDARVHGRKELHLRASGGSDVTYGGPSRVVSRKTSGSGGMTND